MVVVECLDNPTVYCSSRLCCAPVRARGLWHLVQARGSPSWTWEAIKSVCFMFQDKTKYVIFLSLEQKWNWFLNSLFWSLFPFSSEQSGNGWRLRWKCNFSVSQSCSFSPLHSLFSGNFPSPLFLEQTFIWWVLFIQVLLHGGAPSICGFCSRDHTAFLISPQAV